MVRYKLQTFILVVREAFDIGAGSTTAPFTSPGGLEEITGRIVERDSGSRRVKNSVDD